MKRQKTQVKKRQVEAIERLAERQKRSNKEQLDLIATRRGKSKKETKRLKTLIKMGK